MPTPSSTPSVAIHSLFFRYPDGREALRGIDLSIQPGESVALVGPNGAGKSTLLWHLNGLLPGLSARARTVHDHGESGGHSIATRGPAVWIEGLPVDRRNAPEVRRRVGLLFQDPDDQLFCTRVLDDVAFGPLNLGLDRDAARQRALECLARVGLGDAADRVPQHLSFGERKRVCLAGVLACGPSVLALDEPSANLDPRGRRRFMELIASLRVTTIVATHDLEMAIELCPRTVLLESGRVVADGPTRQILGDPALVEAHGLEIPLSLRLRD